MALVISTGGTASLSFLLVLKAEGTSYFSSCRVSCILTLAFQLRTSAQLTNKQIASAYCKIHGVSLLTLICLGVTVQCGSDLYIEIYEELTRLPLPYKFAI
jgi:hypothetical protein